MAILLGTKIRYRYFAVQDVKPVVRGMQRFIIDLFRLSENCGDEVIEGQKLDIRNRV